MIQILAAGNSKLASCCRDRPLPASWDVVYGHKQTTQAFRYWKVEILVNALSAMKALCDCRAYRSSSCLQFRLLWILFAFAALQTCDIGLATLPGTVLLVEVTGWTNSSEGTTEFGCVPIDSGTLSSSEEALCSWSWTADKLCL